MQIHSFLRVCIQLGEDMIIIVSGLPRTGTSMMMNILKNSGIKILEDKTREADEFNPKGYFEFNL